jgi:hypothetical protein
LEPEQPCQAAVQQQLLFGGLAVELLTHHRRQSGCGRGCCKVSVVLARLDLLVVGEELGKRNLPEGMVALGLSSYAL